MNRETESATSEAERVRLTTSCRDADVVPKAPGAGHVVDTPDGPVQVMASGVRIVAGCYYGDWMTRIIEDLQGHHEPQEELAFHVVLERLVGDTAEPIMVELGSFWAYYSLWLLQRAPRARTILVEPDPHNLEVGRRNFVLNGRDGEFVQAAAGRAAAPAAPFICESDGKVRAVPTESVSSLIERFELPRIDVLLADVQGAETALLEGAAECLRLGSVRFVLVSTHHHTISGDALTHQRCLSLLRASGAHIVAEHTVAESFSGDGLIVAAFDERDRDLVAEISHARAGASLFGDPLVDLARSYDEVSAVRDELQQARARLSHAETELAELRSTATWRLRSRFLRSAPARRAIAAAKRTRWRQGR
jgi:FkbM family methyltransferase